MYSTPKNSLPDLADNEILAAIDRCNHRGGPTGRFWTIDPIDGTKGFLRNDQYAIALALIEDGQVVLGVLGCPNLRKILLEPIRKPGAYLSPCRATFVHAIDR